MSCLTFFGANCHQKSSNLLGQKHPICTIGIVLRIQTSTGQDINWNALPPFVPAYKDQRLEDLVPPDLWWQKTGKKDIVKCTPGPNMFSSCFSCYPSKCSEYSSDRSSYSFLSIALRHVSDSGRFAVRLERTDASSTQAHLRLQVGVIGGLDAVPCRLQTARLAVPLLLCNLAAPGVWFTGPFQVFQAKVGTVTFKAGWWFQTVWSIQPHNCCDLS